MRIADLDAPVILAFLDDLVGATPDVHTWIVGNEMNMSLEALGFPGGRIDPSHYANVFRAARARIRSKPGHGDDAVFVGAVAPGCSGGEPVFAGFVGGGDAVVEGEVVYFDHLVTQGVAPFQ